MFSSPNSSRVPAIVWQKQHSAFTLVEIVLAIGLTTFAVLPLVALLALAQSLNREAREKMELALVMESARAILQAEAALPGAGFPNLAARLRSGGATNFFAQTGRFLGTNSSNPETYYRAVFHAVPESFAPRANHTNIFRGSLKIEYPFPTNTRSLEVPLSFFFYGSQQ